MKKFKKRILIIEWDKNNLFGIRDISRLLPTKKEIAKIVDNQYGEGIVKITKAIDKLYKEKLGVK